MWRTSSLVTGCGLASRCCTPAKLDVCQCTFWGQSGLCLPKISISLESSLIFLTTLQPISSSTTSSPLDSPTFAPNSKTSSLTYAILAVSLSSPRGSRTASVSGIHRPETSAKYVVHKAFMLSIDMPSVGVVRFLGGVEGPGSGQHHAVLDRTVRNCRIRQTLSPGFNVQSRV